MSYFYKYSIKRSGYKIIEKFFKNLLNIYFLYITVTLNTLLFCIIFKIFIKIFLDILV